MALNPAKIFADNPIYRNSSLFMAFKISRSGLVVDENATRALPDFVADSEKKTIVVFGVPRGGTTMVAGLVQRAGVYMGDDLPVNLEDQNFCGKDLEFMKKIVGERNSQHDSWGWKFPRAANYLKDLESDLRNPYYVCVWRDIFSAATRGIKNGSTPIDSLGLVHKIQEKNLQFISSTKKPVLLLSYEKSTKDPLKAFSEIRDFTGSCAVESDDNILQFAKPGSYK